MVGGIAQLHYSWSRRGVEGANRFQIVRMSPSLRSGELRPLLPTVRRICRYDRPAGRSETPPTSFGWFDREQYRIAFRRVALPPRGGHVESFAAHVLVGAPAQMRESALASLFGSSFWWSGDDPELPVEAIPGTELPELEKLPTDRRDSAAGLPRPSSVALCHALLTLPRDERLQVIADEADEFGWALREVARLIPDAVTGLSLSTYEGAHVVPFRVTGTRSRPSTGRVCVLDRLDGLDPRERDTARRLLDGDRRASALREALAYAERQDHRRAKDADARRLALWDEASALVALADDATAVHERTLDTTLAHPAGLAYLAGKETGIERIVAAVHGRPAIVLQSLQSAASWLEDAARDALHARIVASYAPPADVRGCGATAKVLPTEVASELLEQVLSSALADSAVARTLGVADVAGVLAHAATTRSANEVASLLAAVPGAVGACAARSDIPDTYLVVMLRALLADRATPHVLADVLSVRPQLLDGVELSEHEKDRCLELLECLDSREFGPHVAGLVARLADARRIPRLSRALERVPLQVAATIVVTAAQSNRDQELSCLCDRAAVRVIEQEVLQPRAGHGPLLYELLRLSRSNSASLALQTLRMLNGRAELHELAHDAAAIADVGLRQAVAELVLARALAEVRTYRAVRDIWQYQRSWMPTESDGQALRYLLTLASRHSDPIARCCVLAWIAVELLPDRRALVSSKRLSDPDADRLVQMLADSVPPTTWDAWTGTVRVADRRARRWWKGVRTRQSRQAA